MYYLLGLGSNLGYREYNLRMVYEKIRQADIIVVATSAIYESKAWLPDGAPKEWDIAYLNAAMIIETEMEPQSLLLFCKRLEQLMGRNKDAGRWSPRIIDIDILMLKDKKVEEIDLIIPHRGLSERLFAILPAAEIAPEWYYPHGNITLQELATNLLRSYKDRAICECRKIMDF